MLIASSTKNTQFPFRHHTSPCFPSFGFDFVFVCCCGCLRHISPLLAQPTDGGIRHDEPIPQHNRVDDEHDERGIADEECYLHRLPRLVEAQSHSNEVKEGVAGENRPAELT